MPALRAVWQAHLEQHDPEDCVRFGTPAPDHHHGRLLGSTVPELVEPFVRGLLVDPPGPTDIVPFTRLDGEAAGELLDVLSPSDLDGRQNDAPTLRAILEATATRPDRLDVHGYAVGPGRCDERVTAEGVHVRFDDDVRLPRRHDDGCDCERLWSYVVDELGLDDDGARRPDEIVPVYRADDERWWRLWWD
ncbi:hypothetical protein GCM10023221_20850 [Luteimicrobium xylanilyticum]|uniref:Uncharacterized protein n=1 Tax=Luteimicrobium xylanilyticum TaxID=1133546 RepID=A0A5P9Q6G2_9MICO|nr:hypothetical protein KDY119_00474 [Luteimicrobium xylanilyticum]